MSTRKLIVLAVMSAFLLLLTSVAGAVPLLQLYIEGGTYDTATETIVTDSDNFVLTALLTPNGTVVDEFGNISDADPKIDWLSLPYYISMALVPTVETAADLGSIQFDGETIDVTGDMTYGNPPLDEFLANKSLPSHGIFDSYYAERELFFLESQVTPTFNTQDAAMDGFITPSGDGYSYFMNFSVDVSGLAENYGIHFDLYNLYDQYSYTNNGGNIVSKDIKVFAPFSHDAETVPEPGTLVLLGIGMLGVAAYRRKMV